MFLSPFYLLGNISSAFNLKYINLNLLILQYSLGFKRKTRQDRTSDSFEGNNFLIRVKKVTLGVTVKKKIN